MSLTRAQLLAAPRKHVVVDVPELGAVRLQAPMAGEWLEYQRWLQALPPDSLEHLVRIVAITAVDDAGRPLLAEDDCRALPHHVLTVLSRAAFELTRITDEKVGSAKGESSPTP